MDSRDLPWRPIMNELVNPWTLWNAEPDFRSHQFEDTIDPAIKEAPVYKAMTENKLDAAAQFELLIRAGLDRVTNARLLTRHEDADLDKAMQLLRPMFCDEAINYVSENHDSGETEADIIIDNAIRRLYFAIRPLNWPWDWTNDGVLRLTPPKEGEAEIAVIPVRGEATIQVELGLVARKVLTAHQVLQVRSLDWTHPVFSDFRCGLFTSAQQRFEDQKGAVELPEDAPRVSDVVKWLLPQIMEVGGTSLIPSDPEKVYSIADATAPDALDELDGKARTLDELGAELDAHFNAFEDATDRVALEAERNRRGCLAVAGFASAPLVPGIDCAPPAAAE